ncbi:efflux transporter periplasmic adaptor subunit [Idiomarina sp. MD25a]|uniref:efflux RND transporter periplasmic adaptor subunit n=1 Tax=Idiomarina sp. MD25a TaxID=1889913 RepID=UPI0008F94795|nr:efflux RND transporter periplasmic adaptor subunit [Idiomarina sp. MD25a]OIM99341.1 efflux transporter periplasmic adaptor subunit [Idiomarina sp. MD25a]
MKSRIFWILMILVIPFVSAQEPVYVCPMHSEVTQHEPGQCPICGMDLVLKSSQKMTMEHAQHSSAMTPLFEVSQQQQQAIKLSTTTATRQALKPKLMVQGEVQWAENEQIHVHPRAKGWTEKLYVDVEGAQVTKGEPLYQVYAPELVVAQDDYLQLLNSLQQVGSAEKQASFKQRGRTRLKLLGMSDEQIARLERTKETRYTVDYFAPQSGYVTALNIQEGMYIMPEQSVMTISGQQALWLMLDIPQRYRNQVEAGQTVHIASNSVQGHWMGMIDYIYPDIDNATQTLRARVPLQVGSATLAVGSWLNAQVEVATLEPAVVIPVSSLIQVGQQNRVVVKASDNEFTVKSVKVGMRVGDQVQILSGLAAGEKVVTNGQFMLDSEASMQGLLPAQDATMPMMQHSHGGMHD